MCMSKGKMNSFLHLWRLCCCNEAGMVNCVIALLKVMTVLAIPSEAGEDKKHLPCWRLLLVKGGLKCSFWEGKGCCGINRLF